MAQKLFFTGIFFVIREFNRLSVNSNFGTLIAPTFPERKYASALSKEKEEKGKEIKALHKN
jgi:hypothetical protein